jgi:hypothetical protein
MTCGAGNVDAFGQCFADSFYPPRRASRGTPQITNEIDRLEELGSRVFALLRRQDTSGVEGKVPTCGVLVKVFRGRD